MQPSSSLKPCPCLPMPPARLPCNGFTLPYNPFTPQCSFLSDRHLPTPGPPSPLPLRYPFRSVSMGLEEGDWCVSQRLVLSDAVRPSLSHGEHVMLDFVSVSFTLSQSSQSSTCFSFPFGGSVLFSTATCVVTSHNASSDMLQRKPQTALKARLDNLNHFPPISTAPHWQHDENI